MYYVYILKSGKDNNLYIGFTDNIERRIIQHNGGMVPSTKNRVPLKLIYNEEYNDKMAAVEREKYLKSGIGRASLKSLLKHLQFA